MPDYSAFALLFVAPVDVVRVENRDKLHNLDVRDYKICVGTLIECNLILGTEQFDAFIVIRAMSKFQPDMLDVDNPWIRRMQIACPSIVSQF